MLRLVIIQFTESAQFFYFFKLKVTHNEPVKNAPNLEFSKILLKTLPSFHLGAFLGKFC